MGPQYIEHPITTGLGTLILTVNGVRIRIVDDTERT
jgi:hypothetical protein